MGGKILIQNVHFWDMKGWYEEGNRRKTEQTIKKGGRRKTREWKGKSSKDWWTYHMLKMQFFVVHKQLKWGSLSQITILEGDFFFGCKNCGAAIACRFFSWYDPPLSPCARIVIIGLLRKVKPIETQSKKGWSIWVVYLVCCLIYAWMKWRKLC